MLKLHNFCWIITLLSFNVYCQSQNKLEKEYFGVNLLKNPGAEQESRDGRIAHWEPISQVSQWNFMQSKYGQLSGEWEKGCKQKCGLPAKAGKAYFRLPIDNENKHLGLAQTIDLTPIAHLIKEQKITVHNGGYIAGFKCEKKDCAQGKLMETYYDKDNKVICAFSQDLDNYRFTVSKKEMPQFRKLSTTTTYLPKEATKMIVSMEAITNDCCKKPYMFFDNISIVLTAENGAKK